MTTHLIQGKEGEKCCPRCNGMVFPAEKMVSINNWYHKVIQLDVYVYPNLLTSTSPQPSILQKKIIRGRSVTSFLNVKFWTEFKIKFPAMLLLPRLPTSVGSVPLLRHPGHGDRVQGLLRQVLLGDQRVVHHVGRRRPQAPQHHHHHAGRG